MYLLYTSRPFLSSVLQTMFWTIELKLPLNLQSRFCRPCTLPGITSRCVMENWRDWGRINHFTAASWRMVKQWQLTLKKQVCNNHYDYLVTKLPSFATSGALKIVNARHAIHKVSRRGKKKDRQILGKMSAQMCSAEKKNVFLKLQKTETGFVNGCWYLTIFSNDLKIPQKNECTQYTWGDDLSPSLSFSTSSSTSSNS